MSEISRATARRLTSLINSRSVYAGMVERANNTTPWDGKRVRNCMEWHNEATNELNKLLGTELPTYRTHKVEAA